MENICICNNCDELFYDTNPQINAKKFALRGLQTLENHCCPNCKTDNYLSDNVSFKLWELLGNIPINNEDEIEEEFLHFSKGTDKFEIWGWFEYTFDLCVARDLMKIN